MTDQSTSTPFQIFRAADAPLLSDTDCMLLEPFPESILSDIMKVQEAGIQDGEYTRLLFNVPGFSLTHVWFKKSFPLPLHSHNADCLYYIVAGSLKIGKETLRPRDGFFVPTDVPYTYRPGPEGVELLEFRHATNFNFVNHSNGKSFWAKALQMVEDNHEEWVLAKMPRFS